MGGGSVARGLGCAEEATAAAHPQQLVVWGLWWVELPNLVQCSEYNDILQPESESTITQFPEPPQWDGRESQGALS